MSHFDTVVEPPAGFDVLASTETCTIAAIADPKRGLYAVQFHPEVAHTPCGPEVLSNFIFDFCHCEKDWDPAGQIKVRRGSDPENRGRTQRILLRQRRRRFDGRVHAVPASTWAPNACMRLMSTRD